MKKYFSAILALALIAACAPQPVPTPTPAEEEEEEPVVTPPDDKPEETPYLAAKVDVKSVMDPGSLVTITVRSNYGWTYTLSEDLFTEKSKTDESLVLASKLNSGPDATVSIAIVSEKGKTLKSEVQVKVKSGLIVDFVFDDDGTARDASPNNY